MRAGSTGRFGLLLWLSLAPVATIAHGQAAADYNLSASARSFFRQGIELADGRQWAEAEDRFRRAFTIRRSPVIAYNLAVVLDEQGEVVEAAELLHRVIERSKPEAPLRASAEALLPRVEARFASLTVLLEGPLEGTRVRIDGRPLHPVQVGVPIPVDPGAHSVSVERAGRTTDHQQVEVTRDAEAALRVSAVYIPTPREVARTAEEEARKREMLATPVQRRWWFWASLGAVAATGVAVAAVLTLRGTDSDGRQPAVALQGSP